MELLRARWAERKFVCVGLDSEWEKVPVSIRNTHFVERGLEEFNIRIIRATADLVCAYKPNFAFYVRHGAAGLNALARTVQEIHHRAPGVPVILDAKLADIGNTNEHYAEYVFDELDADAITVHPYLGREALKPFLDREDKGIFVLCRTSNPGAGEFQDLTVGNTDDTLYEHIAWTASKQWNSMANCGLVVGATYPEELKQIRSIARDLPLLIPGIGAQGGDLEATVRAGMDSHCEGIIINSSRGIIFAGDPRSETLKLHEQIARIREEVVGTS